MTLTTTKIMRTTYPVAEGLSEILDIMDFLLPSSLTSDFTTLPPPSKMI